jgi:hypothetical protein
VSFGSAVPERINLRPMHYARTILVAGLYLHQ